MKEEKEEEEEEETHPMKSLAKPNPLTAKPNSLLCCHLYQQNQTQLQKKNFLSSSPPYPKFKSSVLDSRFTCTKNPH